MDKDEILKKALELMRDAGKREHDLRILFAAHQGIISALYQTHPDREMVRARCAILALALKKESEKDEIGPKMAEIIQLAENSLKPQQS